MADDVQRLLGHHAAMQQAAAARPDVVAPAQNERGRWEMVDYPAALAHGWDIGSGPTDWETQKAA